MRWLRAVLWVIAALPLPWLVAVVLYERAHPGFVLQALVIGWVVVGASAAALYVLRAGRRERSWF